MTKRLFAPGCALMIYKPELAARIHSELQKETGKTDMLMTCCNHDPLLDEPAQIINICPGCDKRFRTEYNNSTTISLWEVLADSATFPFPDYGNQKMTIIDACPTRDQERVHTAVRKIISRMNIDLVEPLRTKTESTCCGDSFYGMIPVDQLKMQMAKKADELPVNDVIVYCVSCSKSMFIGKKQPKYLVDLLFGEMTIEGTVEPDEWHKELREYIEKH